MKKYSCLVNKKEVGVLLIEVLLSVALIGVIVTTLAVGMIQGEESTQISGAYSRATLIAEEGLEAVRNIRDQNFSSLVNGTFGLAIVGNNWTLSGSSDVVDIFTRTVTITTVDTKRKQITVNVTWSQTPQRNGQVTETTYLTNWKATGGGATSCRDYCINLGTYSSGTCRADVAACVSHGEVNESGGDSLCTVGVNDTCCCQP